MTIRPQTAAGVLTVETEAEIDARPRRRLHASERPTLSSERDERLSCLDDDRPAGLRRLYHRVENRTQLRSVSVLIRNQACSTGQNVLGIPETFHHQQLLRIPGDAVL